MAFLKYTETGRSHVAKATLAQSGRLSFSDGARKRFGMDEYTHCVLYYDPETQRVGIEMINDEKAEGAIRLRHRATGSDVSAKSFADFFSIGPAVTTSYTVTRDASNGWLVIDLREGRARKSRRTE